MHLRHLSLGNDIHLPAEGSQGEAGQLEVLQGPGDADDRDEQKKTEDHMQEGDPEAGDQQPDDVQQGNEASRKFSFIHLEGPAEGPEAERSDLDHLETERDPDDGDHHGQSTGKVSYGSGQPPENQPDQVPEEIHL